MIEVVVVGVVDVVVVRMIRFGRIGSDYVQYKVDLDSI